MSKGPAADARRAILLDLLVYDFSGMVVALSVVLAGVLNALGWSIVVVYLFFTAGSACLLPKEKLFHRVQAGKI